MKASGNATKPPSKGDSSRRLAVFTRAPSRITRDTAEEENTGTMEQLLKDTSSWESKMVRDSLSGQMAGLLKVCTWMGRGRDMACAATQTDAHIKGSGRGTRSTDMVRTRGRERRWLGRGSTTN